MPGHKGQNLFYPPGTGFADIKFDLTETARTGDLYEESGFFADSMKEAAAIYNVPALLYSAGGSTLGIQALCAAYFKTGDRILLLRDSHRALVNALVLLGLIPIWATDPGDALSKLRSADGVFFTSPDYFGTLLNYKKLAVSCHKKHIPILVDSAHGAHFPAIGLPTAIALGADACVVGLHKTMPALTGAAAVLLSNADLIGKVREGMRLFGSTSPSYLIALSAENAVASLEADQDRWQALATLCNTFRTQFPALFYHNEDPTRLVICCENAAKTLDDAGISPEYADENCAVLLCSPYNREIDFECLGAVCRTLRPKKPDFLPPELPKIKRTPREAYFTPSHPVSVDDAVGKIAAESVCICPPCRTILCCGELITAKTVKFLKTYGKITVDVLK
jgi:arginine/lysine/ornithine decarboxylase